MTGGTSNWKRIAFFGHFDQTNFGNESTLRAMLHHLRRLLPDAEFTCICTGPAATAAAYNIAAVPISPVVVRSWTPDSRVMRVLRSVSIGVPSEIYRCCLAFMTLKGTDALIVPGTGLLTDAYGLRNWGPYSLFKWSVIAKLCGCKLLFVSVGAGPLYGRLGRWFVNRALALADFRSYRDTSTLQYLESVGPVPSKDRVYPDLAFSFPEACIVHDSVKSKSKTVIGLGVMQETGRYSVDRPSAGMYRNYLDSLAVLVRWLLAHEYDVRLLIGDLGDRPAVQEFKSLLTKRLPVYDAGRVSDEPVVSVEELLSQLAGTDFVVATRFHNVLLALLSNKPTIAISFHHKCVSLMDAMGLSEYCLNITELKADELIEKVCEIERNAGELKALIRERADNCRQALEEQYELIVKDL